MIETEEKLENLEVVKRNGRKVEFDGTKVALAIKKGFDSVIAEDAEEKKYTSKDIQKIYQAVIKKIAKEYLPNGKIKIEEVQDLIEDMLKKYNYDDVYENFSEYRKRRAAAREAFRDDKNMAKLQKKIEGLGLKSANEEDSKRENANIDGNSAMGTMLQFGSTISRAFTETYLMKKKFAEAHENGDIHIHDMDFEAMGTTTCMQIDLNKLFKNGFSTGHGHLREPKDIMSYSALAAIAIQSDQNDQHGGQSIPAFDFYMAPGVLKTFKRQYKQAVYELLDFTDFISFVNMDKVEKEIDKLNSIKNKILEDNKDTLEWIEIREKGCIYYIDVTPRVKSNNNVDNALPSDIVAEKDGVIKHIVVHRGSKVIDNGDYVKKGDILISGNIIKNENVIDKVHSEGIIYAETWKTVNISIPFKRIDYVYKKTINHYYLDIFGHKFTISGKYDSDNTINKKSIVLDKPYLFFKLYKEEKKIYDYNEVILNKEEAYKEALNRSIDVINKKLSSDEYIISKKVLKKEVKRSKINLEVFFKVYEKIGVTSEIQDIGEENGEYN